VAKKGKSPGERGHQRGKTEIARMKENVLHSRREVNRRKKLGANNCKGGGMGADKGRSEDYTRSRGQAY